MLFAKPSGEVTWVPIEAKPAAPIEASFRRASGPERDLKDSRVAELTLKDGALVGFPESVPIETKSRREAIAPRINCYYEIKYIN